MVKFRFCMNKAVCQNNSIFGLLVAAIANPFSWNSGTLPIILRKSDTSIEESVFLNLLTPS